ncbi:protein YLS9-like [Forsythia ovata]|uniref:Protein YLS9-like n=1 Tax=Forsythia ovata TaxID=205694 RepID=A0ABD1SS08_9LAMI
MASSSSSSTSHTAAAGSNVNAANGEPKEVVTGYPLEVQSLENVPVVGGCPHVPLPLPHPQPAPQHAWYAHQQLYPTHYRYQPPDSDRPIFFRAVAWAILFTLISCIFWFLIWLVVHPSFPQLHVSSGELSQVSIYNSTATASCNINLTLTNPNRHLTAIYNHMEISLLYTSQRMLLSQDYLPPLVQPRKNQTVINTDLGFTDLDLGKDVVAALKEDLDQGTFTLGLKVLAMVNFQNGKWKTKAQFMRAFCGSIVLVSLPNNNSRIFQSSNRRCVVYLFSK